MDEQRQNQRWKTAKYLERRGTSDLKKFDVIDLNINQSIGHIIDLNSDGMRLQSEEAMEKGVIFKLRIDLPEEIKGSNQLIVDARSLWSKKIDEQKTYHTGFEFLSKLQSHNEIIRLLFEKDVPVQTVE